MKVRILVFCMVIAVFLSGCSSKPESASSPYPSSQGESSSGGSSSQPAGSEEQTGDGSEPVNYYKYNTYLELLEYLRETYSILDNYFSLVEYEDEFQLLTGNGFDDWPLNSRVGMIHSALLIVSLDDVLELTGEEPYYEELDTIVKGAIPAVEKVDEVLEEIRDYVSGGDWRTDDYAGAAALHTRLMAVVDPFFNYCDLMSDCVDRMEEELNAGTTDKLLQDGEMIAYCTLISIQEAEDLIKLIYADGNYTEKGVYIQNLEEVSAARDDLKEALARLTDTLNDKEERRKVYSINYSREEDSDTKYRRFSNYLYTAKEVGSRADELLETASKGEDVTFECGVLENRYSSLVDCYNDYIVG